jgi:hypothetical protein
MTDNRAVVEIEQDTERELIANVRSIHSRTSAGAFSQPTTGVYAAAGERGAVAVSAPRLGATPILLTVAVYSGAVCIGALVSLNMLHWFWRQLQ